MDVKKWMLAGAATLATAFAAVSLARAAEPGGTHLWRLQHGGGQHAEGAEAHIEAMAKLLELTPSQRKEVAAALTAALPGLEAQTLAVLKAHEEQLELVHAAQLDEEAVRAASAKAGAALGELGVGLGRLLRDVHRVLTPEQLARVEHLHEGDLFEHVAEHVRAAGKDARAWAARQ